MAMQKKKFEVGDTVYVEGVRTPRKVDKAYYVKGEGWKYKLNHNKTFNQDSLRKTKPKK